ncbi:MAG: hypothetical protein OEW62_06130 [Candidatus Bathyarchaeota archaeon]|nr:hypothetical protein [Candidatus Bathyarchaeota archaeon]MDH5746365.1 hypothetical protein [Candidatus Bathyarchaeota archaeon]
MELFNVTFDMGGVLSLIATIIITIIILKQAKINRHISKNIKRLRKEDPLRIVVVYAILAAGFLSLWITVRETGLYVVKRYLLEVNYPYSDRNIFEIIGLILTTNLCFTLWNALTFKDAKRDKQTSGQNKDIPIKGLLNVALQAVIIAFITFVPRHRTGYIGEVGGSIGYSLIVMTMIVSIVVLILIRRHLQG